MNWDLDRLLHTPARDTIARHGTVREIYYDNESYKGRPSRVFAYLGVPESDGPVPGMVLLHGGGGRAFRQWVELWNARGYAAIAMDFGGCGPDGERHVWAGPRQDHPAKFDLDRGWHDLWTYHAISAAMRAHTLLGNEPGVDADRIGVTGISWGGYLTCIMAGVDPRLRFAVPVYGCGFLQDNSADDWMKIFADMTPKQRREWHKLCDPSQYLPNANLPMLFVTGTNDFAYPLDSLRKSADAVPGPVQYCVRLEMPHGHEAGWAPAEIGRFADTILADAPALPQFGGMTEADGTVSCPVVSDLGIENAWLLHTPADGRWQERKWQKTPATLVDGTIQAELPAGTTAWFLAAEDAQGGYASTPPQVRK
jgi:dienelactone hydrolase